MKIGENRVGMVPAGVQALVDAAPDALIFETFSDLREIEIAIRVARQITDLPVIAQMTFMNEGLTPLGYQPAQVARALMERFELEFATAVRLSLAQRARVFCTEDPELRRLARVLEIDVVDRAEFVARFAKDRPASETNPAGSGEGE